MAAWISKASSGSARYQAPRFTVNSVRQVRYARVIARAPSATERTRNRRPAVSGRGTPAVEGGREAAMHAQGTIARDHRAMVRRSHDPVRFES